MLWPLNYKKNCLAKSIISIHHDLISTWEYKPGFAGLMMQTLHDNSHLIKLHSPAFEYVVDFYTTLQLAIVPYNIALTPFYLIELGNQLKGICTPGVDTVCYNKMGQAIFQLLIKNFPTHNTMVHLSLESLKTSPAMATAYCGKSSQFCFLTLIHLNKCHSHHGPPTEIFFIMTKLSTSFSTQKKGKK